MSVDSTFLSGEIRDHEQAIQRFQTIHEQRLESP